MTIQKKGEKKCYVCDQKSILKLVNGQCEKCIHNFNNPPQTQMTNKQSWGEVVERIVIDYANLSGRESANRAEFREKVKEYISNLLISKSEQMEREKIGKNHYVKELTSEDYYGFNAGISKCIEILKK